MSKLKIYNPKKEDYYTFGVFFKINTLISVSWAKFANDPWRDKDGKDVKYGKIVEQNDDNTISSYSLVINRLKLNFAKKK